ncbi:DUF4276 family protein [Viscerimonas tarda]
MKKIAFFVEGQTEQIFVDRLIREMVGRRSVSIISKRAQGGSSAPKQELVRSVSFVRNPSLLVLIYDCGSDNRVKSEIIENIPNLMKSGYSYIVGLRDLYPIQVTDLSRLKAGLKYMPPSIAKKYRDLFDIVVVVQEIETWFLAETHHYQRVDRRLTGSFINKLLGFNPYTIDPLERKHPSKDLNDIYQLVGRSYSKRYWQVHQLVKKLDFDNILRRLRHSISSLNELVSIIERKL